MHIFPKTLHPGTPLSVTVTPADIAQSPYLYVPLEVPPGTTRIELTLSYDKAPDCLVDLGLFDERLAPFPAREGFRGWSGGARDAVFVATDVATPGYVPGPILPGRWHVILGLVRLPAGETEVRLTARADDHPRPIADWQPPPDPVRPGPLWAKGDCQCHTFHSDAKGAPEVLHAQAKRAGLDFLFVTDHNTMTGWPAYFAEASSPDLVFLPGIEITTLPGHGNAFGVERWVDFRLEAPGDPDRLVAEVHAAGGLFSINHDKPDIPWTHTVPAIDCMEVWQSAWLTQNDISLARYDARLAAGRRITAIGGSDWHQPAEVSDCPVALGTPTTVLACAELSRGAILSALRTGTGYVTEAPDGPSLVVTVNGAPMGAVLPASDGALLTAETHGATGDDLVLIAAGVELARVPVPADGRVRIELPPGLAYLRCQIEARASRPRLVAECLAWLDRWHRPRVAEGLHDDGRAVIRALSNPHYFGDWT